MTIWDSEPFYSLTYIDKYYDCIIFINPSLIHY